MIEYMVYWMLGDEHASILLEDREQLDELVPHWQAISGMVAGSVTSLEFSRQKAPRPGEAHTTFQGRYSFEDALEVAGDIGRNFAFFWDSQCQAIKAHLVGMDTEGAGRVRLPDFYGANKDGEWRFGESEEYLRELGSLDESSSWRGKQVIVPNYMQAVSNCIVTRPHYLVCCINECEEMMGYVESAVGAPVASVEELLLVAGRLTNGDDDRAKIDASLISQLHRIADTHGGKVPLHGRLFAQWLHYAFPRDCPFPQKAGTAVDLSPMQYGESFAVSEEEVMAATETDFKAAELNTSIDQWQMSQWSEEEELLGDYSAHVRKPWFTKKSLMAGGGVIAAVLAVFWWTGTVGQTSKYAQGFSSHVV